MTTIATRTWTMHKRIVSRTTPRIGRGKVCRRYLAGALKTSHETAIPARPSSLATELKRANLNATWQRRLEATEKPHARPIRIAIVGDDHSGGASLVSTILDNPLSSDRELHQSIINRRREPRLFIQYGPYARHGDVLTVPIDWLRNGNNIELLESSLDNPNIRDDLYKSDVVFFVTDNIRIDTYPAFKLLLDEFAQKPNVHVIIDQIAESNIPESELLSKLSNFSSVRLISTRAAILANNALRRSSSTRDTSTYQREWLASGIQPIKEILVAPPSTAKSSTNSFILTQAYNNLARRHMEQSDEMDTAIKVTLEDMDRDLDTISSTLMNDFTKDDAPLIKKGYEELFNSVKYAFEKRLNFYKLVWKIDDVGFELRRAISEAFFKDLEQKLIFNAGVLQTTARHLTDTTRDQVQKLSVKKLKFLQQPPVIPGDASYSPPVVSTTLTAPLTITHLAHLLSPTTGPITQIERNSQFLLIRSIGLQVATLGTTLLAIRYGQPDLLPPLLEPSADANSLKTLGLTLGSSFTLSSLVGLRYLQTGWSRLQNDLMEKWIAPLRGKVEKEVSTAREETIRVNVLGPSVRMLEWERRRWEPIWTQLDQEEVILARLRDAQTAGAAKAAEFTKMSLDHSEPSVLQSHAHI